MGEDRIRDDIAFIRGALEEGRVYAHLRSPDITVWGGLMALAYLGTYAFVVGAWSLRPDYVWWPLVGLGWAFSLRHVWGPRDKTADTEPTNAGCFLRNLWFGFGITAMSYALVQAMGGLPVDGLNLVIPGLLGLAFYVSAAATGIGWLRFVALGWWLSEFLFVALQGSDTSLLLGAVLMLGLFSIPGLLLWLRRPALHG